MYLYDGPNDQSTLLNNLNGNLGSFNISSTGDSLFAKFDSDGSVTVSGFLATIHYDDAPPTTTSGPTTTTATTTTAPTTTFSIGHEDFCTTSNPCADDQGDCDSNSECQSNLFCGYNNCPALGSEVDCCSASITQLASPNYPNNYPNSAYETWNMTAPAGEIVTLQFHAFYVSNYMF